MSIQACVNFTTSLAIKTLYEGPSLPISPKSFTCLIFAFYDTHDSKVDFF